MLTGVTPPAAQHSAPALRRLLDLLAQGAAVEEFDRPAAAARQAGASEAELAEIAEAAAVALRIRRTLGQHRVREAQLTALFDTASDLAALRDLDAVLRAIVHRAKLLLGTDVTYLSLNDDTAGDTYMRVTDGSVAEDFQRLRLGMGEGLGGLVAQTARPYATGDYQADPRFHHTTTIDSAVLNEGLRAILGVPLRLGARVIGVLYAADRAPVSSPPRRWRCSRPWPTTPPSPSTGRGCWRRPGPRWSTSTPRRRPSGRTARRCAAPRRRTTSSPTSSCRAAAPTTWRRPSPTSWTAGS